LFIEFELKLTLSAPITGRNLSKINARERGRQRFPPDATGKQ